MADVKVRDLMTAEVKTVGPDDTLVAVQDLLEDHKIRHVPVVDDEGDVVGLVSHRDLARSALGSIERLPVSAHREALSGIEVQEVMSPDPETIEPDAAITDAAALMLENKFGCLPVAEGSRLVGILTEADFVKFVRDHLGDD